MLSETVVSHIKEFWTNHLAAASAAMNTFINVHSIVDSIIVGVGVFLITSLLKLLGAKLLSWWKMLE